MPPVDSTAWERVGRLLAARRAQISPRYANRRTFAAERGMNWRTLHDIEHAKRDNFRPETMRAFETAYALVPGSLDRTLAGGELEPLPDAPRLAPVPSVAALYPGGDISDSDTESAAATELVRLLAENPDDRILAMIAVRGGASAKTRLAEARGWLGVREDLRNGTNG